jgi:hypothetical protein
MIKKKKVVVTLKNNPNKEQNINCIETVCDENENNNNE